MFGHNQQIHKKYLRYVYLETERLKYDFCSKTTHLSKNWEVEVHNICNKNTIDSLTLTS